MNGPQDKSKSEPLPPGLIWRALLLLVLISAAGAWASYHLGWPMKWSGPFFAAITFGAKGIDLALGKGPLEDLRKAIRTSIRGRLTWPVVLVPAFLVAFGGMVVSTVTVRSGAADGVGEVRVAPEHGGWVPAVRLSRSDSVLRFLAPTTPWGRNFTVDADGYAPGVVRAYPLLPRSVLLERHLQRRPSVIFRPGVDGLMLLGNGAVLRVWLESEDGRRELIAADSSRRQTSFVLGRPQSIADSMIDGWRMELARHVSGEMLDNIVRAWQDPAELAPQREVPPGGRLIAEITFNNTVISRGETRLEPTRLIDVPMTDVLLDSGGGP